MPDPATPAAIARLRDYLDEHLKRPDGKETGWDVLYSDNQYGDLDNILDMLPDVFAEVKRLRWELEEARSERGHEQTMRGVEKSRALAAEQECARLRGALASIDAAFGAYVEHRPRSHDASEWLAWDVLRRAVVDAKVTTPAPPGAAADEEA